MGDVCQRCGRLEGFIVDLQHLLRESVHREGQLEFQVMLLRRQVERLEAESAAA